MPNDSEEMISCGNHCLVSQIKIIYPPHAQRPGRRDEYLGEMHLYSRALPNLIKHFSPWLGLPSYIKLLFHGHIFPFTVVFPQTASVHGSHPLFSNLVIPLPCFISCLAQNYLAIRSSFLILECIPRLVFHHQPSLHDKNTHLILSCIKDFTPQ